MVETVRPRGRGGVTGRAVRADRCVYEGADGGAVRYEQLTVDCYFEGSYKKALQALTLNRTLVDAQKARAVLNDLIDANQRYWPELK